MTKGAYAKLHHDMQHFVTEAIAEQLIAIKNSIAQCARKAQKAGIDAIESGVSRVHILDGRIPHCLLLEIFTNKGIGTAILREDGEKYYLSLIHI